MRVKDLIEQLQRVTRKRGRVMKECYGCDKGFIAILHTCGTSARERFIDYLNKQERRDHEL